MAAQGYQLVTVSFLYQFRKAKPEQSTIKIDYRQFKKEEDFQDYCALFEDSGRKHIAGTRYSGTQYFKRVDPREMQVRTFFPMQIQKQAGISGCPFSICYPLLYFCFIC